MPINWGEFVIAPTTFTIPGLFVDLQKFIYAESLTIHGGSGRPCCTSGAATRTDQTKIVTAAKSNEPI